MSQMDKIQIDLHREDFFSRYSKKDLKKILSKILQHIGNREQANSFAKVANNLSYK